MKIVRILPATITAALLLLGVKLVDVARGTEALSEAFLISKVEAQQATEAPKPADAAEAKPEAASEAKPAEPAAEEAKPEEAKKEETAKEPAKEEKTDKSSEEKDEKADKNKNPKVSEEIGATTDHRFTSVEVELLKSLSRRREELDRWERNIQIKEAALGATEKRIDDKIAQIEAMRKDVSALLSQYNTQEDAKLKSLVKIYENMKPKDAARIFNEMEMPVLLMVIDKMSEKKAAPILAEMDSRKAKQITVDLAAQRQLNTARLNTLSSQKTAPQ